MRAGKAILAGTTVTADPRKGMIILRKSEDGLMHLIWKDRTANEVVEDFIVFEGDASIRRVEECKDGYCMLVEFAQMDRKLFYYSQEPRKKGADWEDVSKEKDLLDKINSVLTGGPASGGGGGTGALGMTQAELLAMLGGTVVPQAATSARLLLRQLPLRQLTLRRRPPHLRRRRRRRGQPSLPTPSPTFSAGSQLPPQRRRLRRLLAARPSRPTPSPTFSAASAQPVRRRSRSRSTTSSGPRKRCPGSMRRWRRLSLSICHRAVPFPRRRARR